MPNKADCLSAGRWVYRPAPANYALLETDHTGIWHAEECTVDHNVFVVEGTNGITMLGSGSPSPCQDFTATMTYQGCDVLVGTFVNHGETGGSGPITLDREVTRLSIVAGDPFVPAGSYIYKKVLEQVDLVLSLTVNNVPAGGRSVLLKSSRGGSDQITQPPPTDVNGITEASVTARPYYSASTISADDPHIVTNPSAEITWLPVVYEQAFQATCYVVSLESDFAPITQTNVPGLPPENAYRRGFITDVKLQGSGLTLNGVDYIHYTPSTARFNLDTCARTAANSCAIDGTTLAVDSTVIPFKSNVTLQTVGDKKATDRGGAIDDYHVDEYYGTRRSECLAIGIGRYLPITLRNYFGL
jgi:3D (Asp-Asp-Asp) domain-containing protein